MDPSTSVCNQIKSYAIIENRILNMVKIDLAHVRRRSHRDGATLDDTTLIHRHWDL